MTFDQYANQGDTGAWDPEADAATKRAADKIFEPDETEDENEDAENALKQDPHPPSDVPDPDIAIDN